MWARVVWREETMEMEEVIPSSWVKNCDVYWPTQGAARALKACKEPESSWMKFPLVKVKLQSDEKNECEKYDVTTTAELSGSEEEVPTKRRPKKKFFPDYQMDEQPVNEDSQKESTPDLCSQSTGEEATKKSRKFIPCEDEIVLPTPPKRIHAQSGKYCKTSNTKKRRRILHPANASNDHQAKKRLTTDDFVLPTFPKMVAAKFGSKPSKNAGRTLIDAPPRPQSQSLAHSGIRSHSKSPSNGQSRSVSPGQESLSESLSQRQRGRSSRSSTHGRSRSVSPGQESLSESLSQRQRGRSSSSSRSSTHGRSFSRRSQFKPLLQKRGQSSSESFSRLQKASEPTRSSKNDTPRTTIEKSMRAERDSTNSAEAMSTHAHSNRLRKEDFPMSEKKFQKRVLQLLLEIKDKVNVDTSSGGTHFEVKQVNSEEELEALENRLEDKNDRAALSKHLKRLGGVDAADHVKKSMAATMTNKMMSKMSLRGRSGKIAFMKTHLYKTICDAVFSSFATTTTKVEEYMSKYLKYAPERMGGGGRK